MTGCRKVFTGLLLGSLLCPAVRAQVWFDEVFSTNTLSHNGVTCMHQDRLGFLWIGTFDGLHKYDGYSFKVYDVYDESGRLAVSNRIQSIHEDQHGCFWLMTYEGGVHRFDPSTESFLIIRSGTDPAAASQFTGIYDSGDGILALLTEQHGVTFIRNAPEEKDLEFCHYHTGNSNLSSNRVSFAIMAENRDFWLGTSQGLCRIREEDIGRTDSVFQQFYAGNPDGYDPAIEFLHASDHGGRLWFGTRGRGLIYYETGKGTFGEIPSYPDGVSLPIGEVTTMHAAGENLWIGTSDKKLIRYNSREDNYIVYWVGDSRSGAVIRSVHVDFFDQVWVVTEAPGITRVDPSTGKTVHYRFSYPLLPNTSEDEQVRFLEDSGNRLWVGGQNIGIQEYDRSTDRFVAHLNDPRDPNSLPSNVVECITEDKDGNIWIGTNWFGKGIARLVTPDPAFTMYRPVAYPGNQNENVVRALHVDSRGNTWVGTKYGRVHIYDDRFEPLQTLEKNVESRFTGDNVYGIYEDSRGHVWLATKGAGLFRSDQSLHDTGVPYNALTFENHRHVKGNANSLSNDNVYDLVEDKWGRFWVATYGGGLNLMEPTGESGYRFKHFTTRGSNLTSDKIRDLYIDASDRLWIGTTYGLNFADISTARGEMKIGSLLSSPDNGPGLPLVDVVMVLEDKRGHLWLGTAGGGVFEFADPYAEVPDPVHYHTGNGLPNDFILSLAEDIYGFIWIGTNRGLSRYNPVNGEIKNFDNTAELQETYFSERTATTSPAGHVIFGTISGFYVIHPDMIRESGPKLSIRLTGFELNNMEISPGIGDSPLERTISYSERIRLKHHQSNFAIAFSMLSFSAPQNNHYAYMLEGFDDDWNYIGTEQKATFTNIPPGHYVFRVRGLRSDRSEYDTEAVLEITIQPPVWDTAVAYVIYVLMALSLIYVAYRLSIRFIRLRNEVRIEKRVSESKLRFFTNISHEIRTPLTLILGPLNKLMAEDKMDAAYRNQLTVIHRNTNRLLRMVNQILDFRKVQNEQVTLKIQEISLVPFMSQIRDSFESMARQKNIRFRFVHDQHFESLTIWGDIQKLDIVIYNLLSNAFKFTPENGQVTLVAGYEETRDDAVKIEVRDTGIGIEKEKQGLVFDRFFVSHIEDNAEYQGTGIGLSLAREYVTLHGGEISVESTPGKGTVFTVILPLGKTHFPEDVVIKERQPFSLTPRADLEPSMEEPDPAPGEDVLPAGDAYHILVVEDDVEMCQYLKQLLVPRYRVDLAKNGKEGWELAKELTPDLVITDNMMPEMNGIELIRNLKDEFRTCHIPVIILSSKSEVESQVEGLQTGAESYIPKPFNDEVLLSYVQSFINERERIRKLMQDRVELKPDEIRVGSKDKEFIENVLKMIDENMADPEFNVEKLAAKVFISRTLFYKKIKGITGYQPVELIRMMRLKKASQYIQTGEFNISEVAFMVGYSDIRYFSTSFKKQFGVSPSKYHQTKS